MIVIFLGLWLVGMGAHAWSVDLASMPGDDGWPQDTTAIADAAAGALAGMFMGGLGRALTSASWWISQRAMGLLGACAGGFAAVSVECLSTTWRSLPVPVGWISGLLLASGILLALAGMQMHQVQAESRATALGEQA